MNRTAIHRVTFHAPVRNTESIIRQQPQPPRSVRSSIVDEPKEEVSEPRQPPAPDPIVPLLNKIVTKVEALQRERSRELAEMRELAIELAVVVASHLVKVKLDAGELNVGSLVDSAIAELAPTGRVTVALNPEDSKILQQRDDEPFSKFAEIIDLVEDANLARGSCVVKAGSRGHVSDMETRLEAVRETLLQGIGDARTKCGSVDDDGQAKPRLSDARTSS